MKMTVDGNVITHTPDSVAWVPPPQLGTSGLSAPIFAPYHDCRLIFGAITWRSASEEWREYQDGALHQVVLPHPDTEVMTMFTCYIAQMTYNARTDGCPVAAGAEVELTRIVVL
jgi:hypothetical protein